MLKYVISLGWSPDKNQFLACPKKQAPNLTDFFQQIVSSEKVPPNFEKIYTENMEPYL